MTTWDRVLRADEFGFGNFGSNPFGGTQWATVPKVTDTWTRVIRADEFGFGNFGDNPFGGTIWTAVAKD